MDNKKQATVITPVVDNGYLMHNTPIHALREGDWIVREDGHTRRYYHFNGAELKAATAHFDENDILDQPTRDEVQRTDELVKGLYRKLLREGRYEMANLTLKLLIRRVLYIGVSGTEWEAQMALEEIGARKYITYDGLRVTLYL